MVQLPRSRKARIGVFLGTVVLTLAFVVIAVIIAPYLPIDFGEGQYEEFDGIVPEPIETTGTISVDPATDSGVILIDRSHTNRIAPSELEPLREGVTAAGWSVKYLDNRGNLDTKLSEADAFIVIDPSVEFSTEEANRVESFVANGGRVALFGEPARSVPTVISLSTARSQFGPLSAQLGISFSDEYLFNMAQNDGNFLNIITKGQSSPVADGIANVTLYTAAPVAASGGTTVLTGAAGTRTETTQPSTTWSVAVVDGNVLAVGDKSFLDRANYRAADNERFIANIIEFLTRADRVRTLADYPANLGADPSVQYTDPELLDSAQLVRQSLHGSGDRPAVELERSISTSRSTVIIATFEDLQTARGTGISVTGSRVSVPGFAGSTEGVGVIHSPDSGVVVIAAETPELARDMTVALTNGQVESRLINENTAVTKTDVPESDENGTI